MASYRKPDEHEVQAILSAVEEPQNQPIFVHCQHGENRTGLIMGLYRVQYEHWTPEAAYQEMIADGMAITSSFFLLPYFDRVTGFQP